MKKIKLGTIIFLAVFGLSFSFAIAQENDKADQGKLNEQLKQMQNSCFAKYKLGNETVSVIF